MTDTDSDEDSMISRLSEKPEEKKREEAIEEEDDEQRKSCARCHQLRKDPRFRVKAKKKGIIIFVFRFNRQNQAQS